jgi:Cupin-like domain
VSAPLREWSGIDAATFRAEVATRYEPVAGWPAVRAAAESPAAFCTYLARRDAGTAVDALRMPPGARGRIFYNDDLTGFNFTRERLTVTEVIERVVKYAAMAKPPAIAAQSAPVAECLPAFANENVLALVHESIRPRIWLGSAVVTPAHFDESANVACVVAGRRRFTLLPPGQVANLYVGPLDFAPTGTPVSLVSFREPDFARFPRFREALAHALVTELGPGDAIYIPPLWWHHVESLERLNALVNYWWKGPPGAPVEAPSAFTALHQSLAAFRDAPPAERAAWEALFAHFVFGRD